MKKISILGSTGSIGISALDVIRNNPRRFQAVALTAGKNVTLLKKQIEMFRPRLAVLGDEDAASRLRKLLPLKNKTEILSGETGLKKAAAYSESQMVISAISGAAGLIPTLVAIDAGKDIALANKETMVMAGNIVTRRAAKKGVRIFPVDSEHSAIFQCLEGQNRKSLRRIILTASGGPFLKCSENELKKVTLSDALKHPNWKMGKKITIDSASMMNKGLEIIEAKWLFNLDIQNIDVVIHPQSIVHSMVEFIDGSVIAQMGIPDMRIPIAYALTYPLRNKNSLPRLDLVKAGSLEFQAPDFKKFPCLRLAYQAGITGGTMPAVLNAANEIAVEAFIAEKIGFDALPKIVAAVIKKHVSIADPSLSQILKTDNWARIEAKKEIERITN